MNSFYVCETFDIIIRINLHRSLSCALFSGETWSVDTRVQKKKLYYGG